MLLPNQLFRKKAKKKKLLVQFYILFYASIVYSLNISTGLNKFVFIFPLYLGKRNKEFIMSNKQKSKRS